jgi:hypothetical protein
MSIRFWYAGRTRNWDRIRERRPPPAEREDLQGAEWPSQSAARRRGSRASAETRRKMSEAQRRRQAVPVPRRSWAPWGDALLGVVPDAEVARRTGRGEGAVRSRWARLLIPAVGAGGG